MLVPNSEMGAFDREIGWTITDAIERVSPEVDPAELWGHLRHSRLAAIGSIGEPSPDLSSIEPHLFEKVDWSRRNNRVRVAPDGEGLDVFNVRIFPILVAPDVARRVDGRGLAEIFMQHVIGDPELATLSTRLTASDRIHRSSLLEGSAPYPYVDFHWPIALRASQLAYRYSQRLLWTGAPEPEPTPVDHAICRVLANRIGALKQLLTSGGVEASGTYERTGTEVRIPSYQWSREGISIEVRNGDFCEGDDHRAVPKWTSVVLRSVQPKAAVQVHSMLTTPEAGGPSKSQPQPTNKAFLQCKAWLNEIIGASPSTRTRTNADLLQEAQTKWGIKLSERAFERALALAIDENVALNWAKGGRPKKTSAG